MLSECVTLAGSVQPPPSLVLIGLLFSSRSFHAVLSLGKMSSREGKGPIHFVRGPPRPSFGPSDLHPFAKGSTSIHMTVIGKHWLAGLVTEG